MTNETTNPPWSEEAVQTVSSETANDQLFGRLRAVEQACGPAANKNERVTALIAACLQEGMTAAG